MWGRDALVLWASGHITNIMGVYDAHKQDYCKQHGVFQTLRALPNHIVDLMILKIGEVNQIK